MLYSHLLAAHNLMRWLALAAGLAAFLVAASGWSGAKPAGPALRRFSLLFVIVMDLQFLLGLILFLGLSPVTRAAFQNMAEAMKIQESRFFTVEHTTYMLIAVALAHLGGILARKMKIRGATMAYLFSVLLMLAGIPWWRPLLRIGG